MPINENINISGGWYYPHFFSSYINDMKIDVTIYWPALICVSFFFVLTEGGAFNDVIENINVSEEFLYNIIAKPRKGANPGQNIIVSNDFEKAPS